MKNKSYDKLILFVVYLLFLLTITFFSSCSKDDLFPNKDIEMNIDTRLPIDVNGYSHFKLYSTTTQNIHTISGSITSNGRIPNEPREKVEWESSHYWKLKVGDTIGTIYRRTWRGLGWQIVDSIKVVNLRDARVPTINPVCYNSSDGSINTVIAPIYSMKGDTMTIVAKSNGITKIAKIVLD